ncbi:MAG: dTDP-4-dehydrorhamnose reductase [Thermodesulfobacteriota bacterium]|nr:dTDP-4-dehydrorhamnose reductase [Thermodesulfobacteriota bacterium]
MKILVTGGKGQLGMDCVRVFSETHEVLAIDLDELDITRLADLEALVQKFMPDIIINCAAYTHVDNCEIEKDLAWNVNVVGTKNLLKCSENQGGRLIHVSTDYVFDGSKKIPEPYVEKDKPNPVSYYGKTKYESEKVVRKGADRHVILRPAWMYGVNGHNFLKTMLKLALKNPEDEIRVVNDQYGSPTWSYGLALQIQRIIDTDAGGIYHATAEGYCTWFELAEYFLNKMDVPHNIVPCTSEEFPTRAKRPKNSILENRHLKEKGINIMSQWQDDIDRFVSSFREGLIGKIIKGK